MKDSKGILLTVFIGFVCILLGIFLGRNTTNNYITLQQATMPASYIQDTENADLNTANDTFGKININTASPALLASLPGIGDSIAQRIVDHRELNGPFAEPSDITNVEGIGEKRFSQIKDYITTGD